MKETRRTIMKRVIRARILGSIIFAVALIAWMCLYFLQPFTGAIDVVLQIATWILGGIGFAITVAVYPCERRIRR